MKPQTVGRALGVGLRVAGRMAGQRLGESSTAAAQPATAAGPAATGTGQGNARNAGRKAAAVGGGVARGMGGFLRPFRRVGGILFLEVTGVFFFLFVLVFGNWAWKLRADYAHGPEHQRFLVFSAMAVLFLYLTVSSFWRARRR